MYAVNKFFFILKYIRNFSKKILFIFLFIITFIIIILNFCKKKKYIENWVKSLFVYIS